MNPIDAYVFAPDHLQGARVLAVREERHGPVQLTWLTLDREDDAGDPLAIEAGTVLLAPDVQMLIALAQAEAIRPFADLAGFGPDDEAGGDDVLDRLQGRLEEQRLTILAQQGHPDGAPSAGWTFGVIDEEGGLGWAKETPGNRRLFAWGARAGELRWLDGAWKLHNARTIFPGGWSLWSRNEDGDLDEVIAEDTCEDWTERDAMRAADAYEPTDDPDSADEWPDPSTPPTPPE